MLTSLGAIPSLAPSLSQQLSLFSPSPTQTNQSPTTITNNNLEPIANIPNLAPPFSTVYNAIASEPTSFDMIVTKSGLTSSEVSSILLQLELDGVVSQLPGMMYQKN